MTGAAVTGAVVDGTAGDGTAGAAGAGVAGVVTGASAAAREASARTERVGASSVTRRGREEVFTVWRQGSAAAGGEREAPGFTYRGRGRGPEALQAVKRDRQQHQKPLPLRGEAGWG
ncbi:hypothetical protein DAERI_110066 [Deinococcus aerius]|uniref:Uncharacterized protein n=1 Tax=Deinococcus aerius TaxID=200253 RepID=A0A2I9CXQ4_9DEIO|nr:hypothetical protein DAERI_110066 [Deinococcus aerius]